MPAITTTTPGKIILFGEHAVVYGQPAIAVPVSQVQAKAVVSANPLGKPGEMRIQAPDIDLEAWVGELPIDDPLASAVHCVLDELRIEQIPACTIRVTSSIPVAAGLGSGAAVSVAMIRALSAFLGHPLPDTRVSELAFEIEKLYHGTPSGIDNTVITYGLPIYFIRGHPIQMLKPAKPFTIVIGDTGIPSPTAVAVGDLRRAWQADPIMYGILFETIGGITDQARLAIEEGKIDSLGDLMNQNQDLLRQLGVSSPELDHLVVSAQRAGACGAKLSGGGRGGNMIALVSPELTADVSQTLLVNGATRTIVTTIAKSGERYAFI